MRVAYIYTALTTVGGVDRILVTKANYLAERLGYEVYIITDSQAGKPVVFPLSPLVRHIDLETDFDEQYHKPNIVARYLCYRRLMKQYRKRLTELLTSLHCDVACTVCGRDMDFINGIPDGSVKIGETHIAKPFMRNFHIMEQRGFPYSWAARLWRRMQEQAIRRLDAFVVLTAHDAQSWSTVRQAHVIPNPNTLEPGPLDNAESRTIISVGRLDGQKGYDLLIEAWAMIAEKHPGWCIRIYGEGPLKDCLTQLIHDKGLAESMFICKPTHEIQKRYCESAFYVMSSRFEGFGLVLAEAMSCGIPCISFNCPHGPSEIIQDSEDGMLVPPEDTAALAEAMERMMDDPELRTRLGQNAKRNIQRYSIDAVMQKWDTLFRSLAAEKKQKQAARK